jgi:hypothetical protein
MSDAYYPHNLYLDEKDVEGLKLGDAEVGQVVTLVAKAKVTSVSMNEREGASKKRRVEVTLTEAEIVRPKDNMPDQQKAKVIYAGAKE